MIRHAKAALALLESRGVLTLSELIAAIAGKPIVGSWWSHPKGKLMFAIASELEDHDDVLACKFSKATFVHRAMWAPLARVVTDDAWRRERSRGLSKNGASVVRRAMKNKMLHLDKAMLTPRERADLEKRCILHISSEHTETGAHQTIAAAWKSRFDAATLRASKKLDLLDARATLARCGLTL